MGIVNSWMILFVLFLTCTENSSTGKNDFYTEITSQYLNMGLNVVIPVQSGKDKEQILTTLDIVYDNIFRHYDGQRYASFTKFFIDIMKEKIKINIADYKLTFFQKVKRTKIYEEYKSIGISTVLNKYLINDGETKNGKTRYTSVKELTLDEMIDLKRVLFLEHFIILENDVVNKTIFIPYK